MKVYMAIGLMSGTSLDGVDAALLRTDGAGFSERLGWAYVPYEPFLREKIRACFNKSPDAAVARELTEVNARAVAKLLSETGKTAGDIDVVGFHGQTISHAPERGHTCQMGDGALLAQLTGIDVVNDFRTADVKAGGQGAPLVPVYHQGMAASLEKPVAILNIGGVANVTYIGADGQLIAFDVGPGNALLDDWMLQHTGKAYDADGAAAGAGDVYQRIVDEMLRHPFFAKAPPKSLDRNDFSATPVKGLSVNDGAATLAAFTVQGIAQSLQHLPLAPRQWIVAGGGRLNRVFMSGLCRHLGVQVAPIEDFGFNGNATEAEAFAYLAVRSLQGMPLSFPLTTGVPAPQAGGVLHRALKAQAS